VTTLAGSLVTAVDTAPALAGPVTTPAANPAITIRAIDREGKAVPVTASLQSPVRPPAGIDETLTSAHPTRVPRGAYNIAAWVYDPTGGQTLVDRGITVTRSVTITFDARKGRPIRFVVNDHTVKQDAVLAEPFSPATGAVAFDGFGGFLPAVPYVVPGTMAPGEYLSIEADLSRPNVSTSPVDYVLVKVIRGVIPKNPTFTVDTAKLASDHVTVKGVDPGGADLVAFTPVASGNPGLPTGPFGQSGATPFSVQFHFTPGYQWQSMTDSGTNNFNAPFTPLLGVHHYAQTFDNAAFGPGAASGPSVAGSELQASSPWLDQVFEDPTQEMDISPGLDVASSQTWLYQGSKLLAQGVDNGFAVKISTTPHWYTFRARASRGPGTTLSNSAALYFNFRAWTNSPLDPFWPRIIPTGLSAWNAARHGTRTAVRIYFSDPSRDISAHGVRVWASADGGKTWQPLRVSRSGPHWTVVVTNPGTAGFVSLRVQGTDAHGSTARVTLTSAYAVN
jgi:hypothetical protein